MPGILDQKEVVVRAFEDAKATLTVKGRLRDPLAFIARLGDLTRSNEFSLGGSVCQHIRALQPRYPCGPGEVTRVNAGNPCCRYLDRLYGSQRKREVE